MPYSYLIEKERGRWKKFRKGLRKEDREAFDRLFDRAKFHTAAGVYKARPYPLETILLSICLEHGEMLGYILGGSWNGMRNRNKSQSNLCGFSEWSRSAIFWAIRGALPPARLLMMR
jgi:hypothetical protein